MSTKNISLGFVVRSKGKYLVGKATRKKEPCWTFFKGHQEQGEAYLETAIRELKEETGIDLRLFPVLLANVPQAPDVKYRVQKYNKDVYLFFVDDPDGVLESVNLVCSSFWGGQQFPEIEDYKWCDFEELEGMLFKSQHCVIPVIREMFEKKEE